jgi:hypothetical protein
VILQNEANAIDEQFVDGNSGGPVVCLRYRQHKKR